MNSKFTSILAIAIAVLVACVSAFSPSLSGALHGNIQKHTTLPKILMADKGFFGNLPKVLGGIKVPSSKKLCVITGTTSGLGLETLRELLKTEKYYVICANRDVEKMKVVAEQNGFNPNDYTIMECDLGSFQSVKNFVFNLKSFKSNRPLDRLVCNAAVYQPALKVPKYTTDDIEQQLQINHLSHFLLCSLLINDMAKAKDPRMIIVGSITGNDNTVGGGTVYPLADLGDLKGLAAGAKKPISMIDGEAFNGAKGYKDAKLCNMQTIVELHRRYHKSTGITFSTMYPGCIATTQLFREKRTWFRKLFPLFMKYVTGGFVSENEAGQRLAAVVDDPACSKSGVYWAWNGGAKTVAYLDFNNKNGLLTGAGGSGGSMIMNDFSAKVLERSKSAKMFEYSTKIVGASWPPIGPESLTEQEERMQRIKELAESKKAILLTPMVGKKKESTSV